MSITLTSQGAVQSATFTKLVDDALVYAAASRAPGTIRQYTSNWGIFLAFCKENGLSALPTTVQTVAVYLSALAKDGKAVSTIISHYSAIKYFHDRDRLSVNWEDPIISQVLSGIQRTVGRKIDKADALLVEDLIALVGATPSLRDRAIMLVGFAGAFRRSEITAITFENVAFVPEGMVIHLDRSKTDQEGRGSEVSIPYADNEALCPVRSLAAWFEYASITEGPAFRRINKAGFIGTEALSEETIRLILAKAVEQAGLNGKYSPHSLRAGFCTQAALSGRSLEQIGRQARHVNPKTTLGYIRVAERFTDHAGKGLM